MNQRYNTKIKKIVVLFFLGFASTASLAQENKINTDRPDQSDGVFTMPKNKFQAENGVTFAKESVVNDLMLRYGIFKSTEMRLLFDAGKEGDNNGIKPLTLSLKQKIIDQQDVVPAITLVGYVTFGKIASKDFQTEETPFDLTLALENKLSDKFTLGYNVGMEDNFKDLKLAMVFSFEPVKKLSTFVEYFSTINKLEKNHNVGTGVLFALQRNLQLDVAVERAIFRRGPDFSATVGISYLFN